MNNKWLLLLFILSAYAHAQSTDVFLMPGSDFVRPGLLPRINLNVGIGHSIGANEFTAAYTYENAGSHGFWHGNQGSHTETVGVMRTVNLGKMWAVYGWQQQGITSITGGSKGVQNRSYTGASLGIICHFTSNHGIWFQESYNKVETVPWYTSTNVGYVFSF